MLLAALNKALKALKKLLLTTIKILRKVKQDNMPLKNYQKGLTKQKNLYMIMPKK